ALRPLEPAIGLWLLAFAKPKPAVAYFPDRTKICSVVPEQEVQLGSTSAIAKIQEPKAKSKKLRANSCLIRPRCFGARSLRRGLAFDHTPDKRLRHKARTVRDPVRAFQQR